ncbi:hypothetical protein SAMN05428974_3809 [Sphingopyxis sp. YR583]|nr:hypothetical protein SAMN05428974_3809 [Sphingopyxis sp. YR583]
MLGSKYGARGRLHPIANTGQFLLPLNFAN